MPIPFISEAIKGAADIGKVVDNLITTKGERLELEAADADKVRAMMAQAVNGTWFDSLVDGLSRLIRPGVTIWLLLALDGRLASLPQIGGVDPFWQTIVYLVLTFWFGGRMLWKDIPKMLVGLHKLRGRI